MSRSPTKPLTISDGPPSIPGRGSSKRALEVTEVALNDARDKFNKKLKTVKPKTSFDSQYWTEATEYAGLGITVSKLEFQKALLSHVNEKKGSEEEFKSSDDARKYKERCNAWDLKEKIYARRAEELATTDQRRNFQRTFMQYFTSSPMGLRITQALAGPRSSTVQGNFRAAVIEEYHLSNPKKTGYLMDIVSGRPQISTEARMVAAHIFPYSHGQEQMTAIFGEDARDEMFSPRNGLILPDYIENNFDNGRIAIVPDIKDLGSKAEMMRWTVSQPHEYRWKIFMNNPKEFLDAPAGEDANGNSFTYRQIDGKRVLFPKGCNARPRARYLYFHYCCQILRQVWRADARGKLDILVQQDGLLAWGTVGKYIASNHLRAFVDELGHQFEPLMQNATGEERADSHSLVEAIADQVLLNRENQAEEDDDEEDKDAVDDE